LLVALGVGVVALGIFTYLKHKVGIPFKYNPTSSNIYFLDNETLGRIPAERRVHTPAETIASSLLEGRNVSLVTRIDANGALNGFRIKGLCEVFKYPQVINQNKILFLVAQIEIVLDHLQPYNIQYKILKKVITMLDTMSLGQNDLIKPVSRIKTR
jgi:hypothetical protein